MIAEIRKHHEWLKQFTDKVIDFCIEHKVEVVRGEDYQYQCWIDNEGSYATSLTAFEALYEGILNYDRRTSKT